MTSGEEKMPILRDIRRRFHRYRFEDLPPETQEAVIQIRGYEESRSDPGDIVVSKGDKRTQVRAVRIPRIHPGQRISSTSSMS